ncbi:MAG: hypothetical protein ACYTF7_08265 [Planctomycetota bacterium]|jgi:hypothetical protein
MTRFFWMNRIAQSMIVGGAVAASVCVAPGALADGPRGGISVQVPIGDRATLRVGLRDGYSYRDDRYRDRDRRRDRGHGRRSWGERLHYWFDELGERRRDARRALRGFERLADERPRAALPKVGIALASLRLGYERDAIWAMRRAVRQNPGVLHRVPVGFDLYDDLYRIEKRLKRSGRHDYNSADEWFLIAAVRVVAGQEGKARRAIRYALDQGDRSRATVELARYLGVRVHRDRGRDHPGRGRGQGRANDDWHEDDPTTTGTRTTTAPGAPSTRTTTTETARHADGVKHT